MIQNNSSQLKYSTTSKTASGSINDTKLVFGVLNMHQCQNLLALLLLKV